MTEIQAKIFLLTPQYAANPTVLVWATDENEARDIANIAPMPQVREGEAVPLATDSVYVSPTTKCEDITSQTTSHKRGEKSLHFTYLGEEMWLTKDKSERLDRFIRLK